MQLIPCPGCGGLFPPIDGPSHLYMESSPGCWAAFGNVLTREYSDPTYAVVHRLTVDAYAIQHPGRPSPQSIQSVALHLMSLFVILESGWEPNRATTMIRNAAGDKSRFIWLKPPTFLGEVTVADVGRASSAVEHVGVVREWARSVWSAWAIHHPTIRTWAKNVKSAGQIHRG